MHLSPTEFLHQALEPVSKHADANGAPNAIMGIIASGGQPHVYITGNVTGNLQIEIYEALADWLKARASELRTGKKAVVTGTDFNVRM